MKLLLDTCVWGKATDELRAKGHDVGRCLAPRSRR